MRSDENDTPRSSGQSETVDFEQLFARYSRAIYSFFINRGFSAEESRDLTQETFFSVYRGMRGFRNDASIQTWLFKIAGNVWRNALRNRSAIKRSATEFSLDQVPAAENLVDSTSLSPLAPDRRRSSLQDLLDDESRQLLRNAIEGLPPQMRRCLQLRVNQELKYREIAAVLQVSIETVKSQLYQARERLKRQLATHFTVDV